MAGARPLSTDRGLERQAPEAVTPIIAGRGLVTALGNGVGPTWTSLIKGEHVINHAQAAGGWHDEEPHVVQMARLAAEEAKHEAGWTARTPYATVVGTSKGSIKAWIGNHRDRDMGVCGLGDVAVAVASDNELRLTYSGACASGLMALARAALLIRSGEAERVLVVGTEASVHPLFLGSFARLGVLPPAGERCRPFDVRRSGFLMSEAAAAVCIEAVGARNHHGVANALARQVAITRIALAGDATHLTGGDAEGRVLRRLIEGVVDGRHVDLVHAHGTGTVTNDPIELAAIDAGIGNLRSEVKPLIYSHKAAIGHSLGAAGLVSVVISSMCHEQGVVPPNVCTNEPMSCTHVTINGSIDRRPVSRSIAIAAGFGGAMAAVTLETINRG